MSKLRFLAVLLILFCSFGALAQKAPATPSNNYLGGYNTFLPLSSVTSSEYLDFSSVLPRTHTIDWSVGTGSLSVCTFNVQGSSDHTNWYDLSGTQTCTTSNMFHIESKPVRYLRINILTYTGTAVLTYHYTGVN